MKDDDCKLVISGPPKLPKWFWVVLVLIILVAMVMLAHDLSHPPSMRGRVLDIACILLPTVGVLLVAYLAAVNPDLYRPYQPPRQRG